MTNWTIMDLGSASLNNYRRSKTIAGQVLRRTNDKGERSIIGGMISDCQYVIDHYSQGRVPDRRQPIYELPIEKRTFALDSEFLNSIPNPIKTRRMNDNDYNRLLQVMAILSNREKQCFEMHYVGLWSEYDIAKELNITRGSVQEYLDRAKQKISKFINNPIQMELFPME